MAERRVAREDYSELGALQREGTEMLRRWLGAREMTVEAFEGSQTRIGFQPVAGRRAVGHVRGRLVMPSKTVVRLWLKVSSALRWAPSMTSRAMVGYLPVSNMRVR